MDQENIENVENGGGAAETMDTMADVVPGMKRPAGDASGAGGAAAKNKKRKKVAAAPPIPKNALMQLNEIRPGLIYNVVSQGGPVHNPEFTVAVEVNGQMFQGMASSKKKAKLAAAENALSSFVQLPTSAAKQPGMETDNGDFTGDDTVNNLDKDGKAMVHQGIPITKAKAMTKQPEGKNPVMILNEIRPGTQYVALTDVATYAQTKVFIMEVNVDGKAFQGEGRNKKLAKARAAQAALKEIFNLEFKVPEGMEPVPKGGQQGASATTNSDKQIPPLADRVAKMVQAKFAELTSGLNSQYARRKVLAGVVMTINQDLDSAFTLCVTTGTKCVNGEYMSVSGLVLNDCHAEILARRCLRRFLFDQLQRLADGDGDQSAAVKSEFPMILEAHPDTSIGGYRVKEGVEFHLYISTSPCGDARIFSPHENTHKDVDKHPNRKARGQLRTKIESGEGTIPITEAKIQTWDGIVQGGERLLTMSCSDKIARWNVIGFQGALLSYFVEPLYFSSVVVGSFFHNTHMARAVLTRYGPAPLEGLPAQFRVHAPLMSGISNSESRVPGKATSFAINWYLGNEEIEVITTMRGKTEREKPSQLCKYEMYKLFSNLYGRLLTRNDLHSDPKSQQYCDIKAAQDAYQQAKGVLAAKFKGNSMGFWVNKPREQDEFTLEDAKSAMESMIQAMQASIEQMKGGVVGAPVKKEVGAGGGVGDASLEGVASMFVKTEPDAMIS